MHYINSTIPKGKRMRNANMLAYVALVFIAGALALTLIANIAPALRQVATKVDALMVGQR
jgi:hypothetical protein